MVYQDLQILSKLREMWFESTLAPRKGAGSSNRLGRLYKVDIMGD